MRRIVLLSLVLPAFVACGANETDDAPDAAASPATESTSPSAADDFLDPAKDLSEDELAAVLPTLQDMPAGFTKSSDDSDDEEEEFDDDDYDEDDDEDLDEDDDDEDEEQ